VIRVTTTDLGIPPDPSESQEIEDDYVIVCAGSCYVAHVSAYNTTGTHVVTIKGRRVTGAGE
jgi:hypothetical protein